MITKLMNAIAPIGVAVAVILLPGLGSAKDPFPYSVQKQHFADKNQTGWSMMLNRLAGCPNDILVFLDGSVIIDNKTNNVEMLMIMLQTVTKTPLSLENLELVIDGHQNSYDKTNSSPTTTLDNGLKLSRAGYIVFWYDPKTNTYGGHGRTFAKIANASNVSVRIQDKARYFECDFHAINFARFRKFIDEHLPPEWRR